MKLLEFTKYLKNWGEAETVKTRTHTTPKMYDRGITCMVVSYAKQHAGDTYRMWDTNTKQVHVTRYVIWLNKISFKEKPTIYFNPATNIEKIDENEEHNNQEKVDEEEVNEEGELISDNWDEQRNNEEPREKMANN